MALPCERHHEPGQGGEAACLHPCSSCGLSKEHKNTQANRNKHTNILHAPALPHPHTHFWTEKCPEATVHFRYISIFSWFSYAKYIQPSISSPEPGVLPLCTSPCSICISQTSALPSSAVPVSPMNGQHFWLNSNSFISTLTFNLLCLDTLD